MVDDIWSTPSLDDEDDRTLTYRVMTDLPVIVLEGDERRTMKMRWDFRIPTIGKFRSPSMLVPKR